MAYSAIIKPTDYFNTKLYTGTDNSNAITGVGFQPDWVWLKNRSTGSNKLMDAVRGSNSSLCTNNSNAAEGAAYFSSFDSNGFTVDTSSSDVNADGQNYVGWNWKANGQGSSNTDGTINSTYTSASTASGFSIVKYQGTGSNATVGHGLGAVPKMIIIKCLQQTHWWFTYHVNIGNTKHVTLNTTNAESGASSAYWNNTTPTSSVFSIGTDTGVNQSGQDYIAYCFADVQGFSKIGYYLGNQLADGPFLYTGFKPAFILSKKKDGASDWYIFDSKREGYNIDNDTLLANQTNAESTTDYLDIFSNGYKVRTTDGDLNTNNGEYVYLAFAENPFVANVDGGLPTTAR
tara:strand:+ start:39 stop:1076 length:1038 start_codon:yes stop_codon:yes gene_type:complete